MLKDYGETSFITGLRAWAVMGVVLIHSGGAGLRNWEIGNNLVNFGAYGVYVFFVISGFSVSAAFEKSRSFSHYMSDRIWRIAPLYNFWILMSIWLGTTAIEWQNTFDVSISPYNVLMHISFLSFLDYRIANSIIGVEWTLPLEVFWYFLVPLMLFWTRSVVSRGKAIRLISLGLVALLIYSLSVVVGRSLEIENLDLALSWSPIPYVFCYALGVIAFRLRSQIQSSVAFANGALMASAVIVLFGLLQPNIFMGGVFTTSILTAAIIVFGTNKSGVFRVIFGTPPVQFIGVVSFGIYLSHFPVLRLIERIDSADALSPIFVFTLTTIFSILVSALTYFSFELRTARFGKTRNLFLFKKP